MLNADHIKNQEYKYIKMLHSVSVLRTYLELIVVYIISHPNSMTTLFICICLLPPEGFHQVAIRINTKCRVIKRFVIVLH